jgi:hypothetical protein
MLFDQHHVFPTVLGQMVGHAHTDGTTADDDHSCLSFHIVPSPLAYRYCVGASLAPNIYIFE